MASPQPDQFPRRFGKYQLIRRVASGGMADLYLAIETTPGIGQRFVIVKRIRPEHVTDTDYVEFFLTEGRVAVRCAHPNLPQTYELARREGAPYLAMEYIAGHTLLDVVNAATAAKKQLSAPSVLRVGIGVAAALEHLHTLKGVDGEPLSVVHRDVTPQNVMLSDDGTVKLIDFGIVRSSLQTHKTRAGVVKGKFSYLAPEALERNLRVDHRADLFSLGIVMHESLTGRSLFRGRDDAETMKRIKFAQVPDLSAIRRDVPEELADVIDAALEKDPERRYPSATELLVALERAAEKCGILPSRTRMRREVHGLCGPVYTPKVPTPNRRPGSDSGNHLTADLDLSYFLNQAERGSANFEPSDDNEDAEESEDSAFDELLARLVD